ncbi:MAG: hypothetical protein ABSH15_02130 [Verrucomicrobiota bacterium]|jgi:hypothetical protein
MNTKTEPTGGKSPLYTVLHLIAATILLLFAASHFAFLTVPDVSHNLQNPVFPVIPNKTMYLIAGLFEAVTGLLCLRFRGRDAANIVILTFVGVILWYRWAFYFVGGTQCSCLGILGRLLHLSKTQEKVLPIVALVLLTMTTLPWLIRILWNSRRRASENLPLIFALAFLPQVALGQKSVEVTGELNLKVGNPRTGAPYTNQEAHSSFTVTFSGDTWSIHATNLLDKRWWEELVWDGTNIYTMEPQGGNYYFNIPPTGTNLVTIRGSQLFETGWDDPLGVAALWIAYGFAPQTVSPNNMGLKEVPLPWEHPRNHPDAYGYNWIMTPSADGRFLEDCKMVRDQGLDLNEKQESLRPEVDFPVGTRERNHFKVGLSIKKAVPSDFVAARYHCAEWYHTNGMAIPAASELTIYYYGLTNVTKPSSVFAYPYKTAEIKATSVKVDDALEEVLQPAVAATYVEDYRYKRMSKTRIFRYAGYWLNAGEPWKSGNDPALLAQAEYGLKHGPRFDELGVASRNVVAWLLLALGVIPPMAIFFALGKKQKQLNKKI